MNLSLREFDEQILAKSFAWLTDSEIKFLTASPEITVQGQENWFKSLVSRKDYILRAVFLNEIPIGVVGLKNISSESKDGEYFGYIGDKTLWGRGIGKWMLLQSLDIASREKLSKVYLHVIYENYKAINLYFKYGFKITNILTGKYLMEKSVD